MFFKHALKDIDLEKMTVNIDHQLQRTSDMRYIIETTKTDAGTRVLPITEDVAEMFQAIIEDRNAPKVEKSIDGYSGFLFYDDREIEIGNTGNRIEFSKLASKVKEVKEGKILSKNFHFTTNFTTNSSQ